MLSWEWGASSRVPSLHPWGTRQLSAGREECSHPCISPLANSQLLFYDHERVCGARSVKSGTALPIEKCYQLQNFKIGRSFRRKSPPYIGERPFWYPTTHVHHCLRTGPWGWVSLAHFSKAHDASLRPSGMGSVEYWPSEQHKARTRKSSGFPQPFPILPALTSFSTCFLYRTLARRTFASKH